MTDVLPAVNMSTKQEGRILGTLGGFDVYVQVCFYNWKDVTNLLDSGTKHSCWC